MKNNPIAKFAKINRGGFHTERNKPSGSYSDELYQCGTCHKFDETPDECLFCGSMVKRRIN